jgi:hypothetical protein
MKKYIALALASVGIVLVYQSASFGGQDQQTLFEQESIIQRAFI